MKSKPFFLLLWFLPCALSAQDLAEAKRLAEAGRHLEAEKIYNIALDKDPDHLAALIGAGYNYSWAKQHRQAAQKFEAALALDPDNASALVGKGYNLAWSGQYAAAKYPFQTLERLQPGSPEARKGLGYVYLWQGDGTVAIDYFEKLVLEYPREMEYYIALAQSYLLENQIKKARIALQSGLQIDPSNRVAGELLRNTYGVAAPVELDVWTGYSKVNDMGTFNLRTVQLTGQVSKKLRMFLKYDNSLSLDLSSLVRKNQEAQAFSIGGVLPWSRRLTSRFEYGTRLLPDNVTQQVFSTEQVYFLPNRMSLKGGGFFAPSQKMPAEWLAYGSVRVPITARWTVEPYYFYARVENAARPENRFMLNNQWRNPKGYELNFGLQWGKAALANDAGSDNIWGSYVTALLPFSQTVWGQLSLRWESAPFDDLLAAAFGVRLRLER
ncbi:MAG TPA: tetratricopeptide repeat protein [Saprospiraceae bacterium]|nr:tetratricopeptide repeat protein [Saprospiraceae bacterium]HND87509.1 tetratricopeptide repeat protein [Saprospiraceae bacterium]HNG89482.1 tetratricopeptide repeat protein [Saprospiraceae bacterium]